MVMTMTTMMIYVTGSVASLSGSISTIAHHSGPLHRDPLHSTELHWFLLHCTGMHSSIFSLSSIALSQVRYVVWVREPDNIAPNYNLCSQRVALN